MATDTDTGIEPHGHHHAHGPANRGRRVLRTAAPLFVRFPSTEARAAVIVLHDVYGLTEPVEDYCRALADCGYIAIAPYLYYDTGGKEFRPDHEATARATMSLLAAEDLVADLSGAVDYLIRRVGIESGAIGILGVGMGGYLASWATVEYQLAATVAVDPLGLDGAPWWGMPELGELIERANSPWLGIAAADGPLPPGQAHALAEAACSQDTCEVVVMPAAAHGPGDRPNDVGRWDETMRFFDARIGR